MAVVVCGTVIAAGVYLVNRGRARTHHDELLSRCSTEAPREHKALDMANKAVQ
jgi:hypothetical protein